MQNAMTTYEFRELSGCNVMGLNNTGSLALIAGRRSYGIVNLHHRRQKTKNKLDRKIRRRTNCKYEVTSLEFHPFREDLSAVVSNDRVELIDWSGLRDMTLLANIKAHVHVVNDISWHRTHGDSLATCSMDSYINIWDIREMRKASLSLSSISPASQVQWERLGGDHLASAHEGEIKLWDIRNPSAPVITYVNAHLSKIYSLDFSSIHRGVMVSSSQDSTVKVWELSNTRSPVHVIRLPQVPAWKARFTPFGGDGLVTLTMHTIQRCENNLMLWNVANASNLEPTPEHVFAGHIDMVMEFAWRKCDYYYEGGMRLPEDDEDDESNEDISHYQLVTWSKDNSLKIWPLSEKVRSLCGEFETSQSSSGGDEIGREATEDVKRDNAPPPTTLISKSKLSYFFKDSSNDDEKTSSLLNMTLPNFKSQTNLQQEFSLLNFGNRLVLEKMDLNERYCIITAETIHHNIALHIKFPANYPGSNVPLFSFLNTTTLDAEVKSQLLRKLKLTAHQQVIKAKLCLEMCLRQFELAVENIYQMETESMKNQVSSPTEMLGVYQDTNIPFPRTSGARFCGMGQLVCFGFSSVMMIPNENKTASKTKTPRSMSAANPPLPFYGQTSNIKARRGVCFSRSVSLGGISGISSNSSKRLFPPTSTLVNGSISELRYRITIYDVLAISSLSKVLAEKCVIADDKTSVLDACITNANLAASVGRNDIAQTWRIASRCAQVLDEINNFRKSGEYCTVFQQNHGCAGLCSCSSIKPVNYRRNNRNFLEDELPWAQHPFGRKLLDSLIAHYVKQQDLQTASLLLCNFHQKDDQASSTPGSGARGGDEEVDQNHVINSWDIRKRKNNSKSECSVDTGRDIAVGILASSSNIKHSRSNSDTLSLDDYAKPSTSITKGSRDVDSSYLNSKDYMFLDPSKDALYDDVKGAYARLLLKMGLNSKSTLVRKRLTKSSSFPDPSNYIILTTRQCPSCSKMIRGGSRCRYCNNGDSVLSCSLCQFPCRGLSSMCIDCGHGGHLGHVIEWFRNHEQCPTGCGCNCIFKG